MEEVIGHKFWPWRDRNHSVTNHGAAEVSFPASLTPLHL